MKNFTRIIIAFAVTCHLSFVMLSAVEAQAQAPQAIPYQAIARDNSGNVIANQNISLRFSIHDATTVGWVVYQETQSATTNLLGLFTVNIGQGTVVVGTFATINWGTNAKFIQVEFDAAGGSTYVDMGTQQMLSVPYALYAATSGTSASTIETDPKVSSATTNQVPKWNGTALVDGIITDNGARVGIGTTSPSVISLLSVGAGSPFTVNAVGFVKGTNISLTNTSNQIAFGGATTGTLSWTPTSARTIILPDVSGTALTTGNLSSITGVGTITSGTWNGSAIGNSFTSGTSANTPNTLVLRDGSGNFSAGTVTASNLAMTTGAGASKVLTSDGSGNASWQAPAAAGISGIGAATRVAFWNGASSLSSNSNLYWDNTNARLGIGTSTPEFKLSLDNDGGIIAKGTLGSGNVLTTAGAGTRLIWYPKKAAFRVGEVGSTKWDDINIGDHSFASGYDTKASEVYSTAMGFQSVAFGTGSTALGVNTGAGGFASVSMGQNTSATGANTTAMGNFTTASGGNSTAMGNSVSTNDQDGSFAIGDNSTTTLMNAGASDQFSARFAGGYRLYSDETITESNGMFFKGGNLGIGTSSPSTHKLEVIQTGIFGGARFIMDSPPNGSAALSATTNGGGPAASFSKTHPTSTSDVLYVLAQGLGTAGNFNIFNAANSDDALYTKTTGTGNALMVDGKMAVSGQLTSTVATGTAPLVIASTTLVPNLHVALADVATTASNAPVLASSVSSSTTAITTACVNYAGGTVTIIAPATGTIVIDAHAWLHINHTSGTLDQVNIGIGTTSTECPTANNGFVAVEDIPSNIGTALYNKSISISRVIAVSAGTYTYYLNGNMSSGQDVGDVFWYANIHAVWYK